MPILALVANPQAPIARQIPRLDFLPEVDRRDLQKIFKEAIATRAPEALEAAWDALEAIARQDYPELLKPTPVPPVAAAEGLLPATDDRPIEQRVLEAVEREELEAVAASVGGLSFLLPQLSAKARLHYINHTQRRK